MKIAIGEVISNTGPTKRFYPYCVIIDGGEFVLSYKHQVRPNDIGYLLVRYNEQDQFAFPIDLVKLETICEHVHEIKDAITELYEVQM